MHTLGGEIITSFVMAYDEVGNLWLLYQMLGNIPLTKLILVLRPPQWPSLIT